MFPSAGVLRPWKRRKENWGENGVDSHTVQASIIGIRVNIVYNGLDVHSGSSSTSGSS